MWSSSNPRPVRSAVVVGGGVAGLAAAAALASRGLPVVLMEGRPLPDDGEVRSVVPQGRMPHVLLAAGAHALEQVLPGFADELSRAGAVGGHDDERPCHWWAAGAVRRSLPGLGIAAPMCSRALVESTLRRLLRQRPGIEFHAPARVGGLLLDGERVRGVRVGHDATTAEVEADLVVDATGRAAAGVRWLALAGLPEPPLERVRVDLTYTALDVPRQPGDLDGGRFAVVQNSRTIPRIGVALPAEGERWQIVLGGYFGDAAPSDRSGLTRFAAALPDPVLGPLLERDWLGPPRHYRFPASEFRRWDRLRPVAGLAVIGDAVASFNPVYGQGMSSAAVQALELARHADGAAPTAALSSTVARAVARVAAVPWQIATGADFIYPRTRGRKPAGTDALNGYLDRVMVTAAHDEVVNRALTRVQQLLAGPRALLAPTVVTRVLAARVA